MADFHGLKWIGVGLWRCGEDAGPSATLPAVALVGLTNPWGLVNRRQAPTLVVALYSSVIDEGLGGLLRFGFFLVVQSSSQAEVAIWFG